MSADREPKVPERDWHLVTPEQSALIAYLDRRNPGWDRRAYPRPTDDRRKP